MLEIMWDASAFDLDCESPDFSVLGIPIESNSGISWTNTASTRQSANGDLTVQEGVLVGHLFTPHRKRLLIPSNNYKNRIHICAKPAGLLGAEVANHAVRTGVPLLIGGGVYVTALEANYTDGALFFIGKPVHPKNPNAVITEQPSVRPPLGLKPEKIWKAQRAHEIHDAIGRYLQADKRVPSEWYDELKKLTDQFEV